jgi:nucleotide-binding universal stress UspA family protein
MFKRQPILVAIDDVTALERTMDVALAAAKAREGDVHIIQVASHRAHDDDGFGRSASEGHDYRGATIGAQLPSIAESADLNGVRVETVTLRGKAEHVIPAYAELHRAAMVVINRDYGSSRYWRSGRVVNEISRRFSVPLLVIPKRSRHEPEESPPRHILTPFDFSIASAIALKTTVDLARRHDARVTVLHALNDVPRHMVFSGSQAWKVIRRLPQQVAAVTERLRRRAAFFGANGVEIEVATGAADSAILEFAARGEADLVVMGIAHRSRLDRLALGSTLRSVLRRTTVPVLVVPAGVGTRA